MSLRSPAWFVALSALVGASLTVSVGSVARAQVPTAPTSPAAESAEAGARRHFQRALEQYRSGQYSRALSSLKEAIQLDPDGKDLFFNLALVHEKLGQLPEAIAAWQRFEELEPDAAERERAEITIARLRGAAAELAAPSPSPAAPCPEPPPAPAPAPRGPSPVLIGSASIAAVALVVGAVFGGKAWADDVSDERTSTSLSVTQLRERGRRAAREALIADVAFAVAGAAGGTFACVWLLTPSQPTRAAGITLKGDF
jgi:tetratricopeptide (TPR) repeat protein